MDQAGKTFTSEGTDPRKWIGRIIMAVILGEAIWNLIVSVMNYLVVPWLGDVFGQSSGLPTSFTQRPYDYPDLFVSVVEFCIAGLVAAIINYFFQRPRAVRVKTVKNAVPVAPVEPLRVVPPPATTAVLPQPALPQAAFPQAITQVVPPVAPSAPVAKPEPVLPAAPVITRPAAPPPVVTPTTARPAAVAPSAPPVASSPAKPLPPALKAEPPKPKKPKEVYYNIVGEPMPSDDD